MRGRTQRQGFTLIELLIVIVIIGILAAIAIPRFGATRERAFFKAMQSDLRNLVTQQELYYSLPGNDYTYATDEADPLLEFQPSSGVTVDIGAADNVGWSATATHDGLDPADAPHCAVFVGEATAVAPAVAAGVIRCIDEDEP